MRYDVEPFLGDAVSGLDEADKVGLHEEHCDGSLIYLCSSTSEQGSMTPSEPADCDCSGHTIALCLST